MTLAIAIRLVLICLTFVSCQEGIRRSRVSSFGGKRLKRLTIVSEVPTSQKRTTYETRRFLEPESVSKTASGLLRQNKRLTIPEVPASRIRTTTQTRRFLEPEAVSKTTSGLPRQSKRLTIVSEVPASRKRTTYETRRLLEPKDVSKSASLLLRQSLRDSTVATNRPAARSNYFDDLKQAKEGVWYRRVEDDEGVRLIRVKNDDAILNNGDQRNSNYQLSVEEKDPSEERFWYRRLEDGEGGVRLVRVRNDDITIKSLKTFRTQNITRTRISEAV